MATEAQNRARTDAVHEMLQVVFSHPNNRYSKNDLLATHPLRHNKECSNSRWVKSILERMVSFRLLEKITKNNEVSYAIGISTMVAKILVEWNDGNGVLIPAIVFPNQFDFKTLIKHALAETQLSENDIDHEAEDSDIVLEQRISRTEKNYCESFSEIKKVLIILTDKIQEQVDALNLLQKTTDQLFEETSANFGEITKKIGGNNKRIDALEKRIAELANAVAKIRASDVSMTKLQTMVTDTSRTIMLEQMSELQDKLVKQTVYQEIMDKIGNHIKEGQALQELLIDKISG